MDRDPFENKLDVENDAERWAFWMRMGRPDIARRFRG